ncbi:unnamed protein product [Symbiodinium sp. CCMP2592]|nr:unnamed protein product [Symbiodinium sp. CCMP2592]
MHGTTQRLGKHSFSVFLSCECFYLGNQVWILVPHEALGTCSSCEEAALLQRTASLDSLASRTSRLASLTRALGYRALADNIVNASNGSNRSAWQGQAYPGLVQQVDSSLEDLQRDLLKDMALLQNLGDGLAACNRQLFQDLEQAPAAVDILDVTQKSKVLRSCIDSSLWTLDANGWNVDNGDNSEGANKVRKRRRRRRRNAAWTRTARKLLRKLFLELHAHLVPACSSQDVCWAEGSSAYGQLAASVAEKRLAYEAMSRVRHGIQELGNCLGNCTEGGTEGREGPKGDSRPDSDLAPVAPIRASCELTLCVALSKDSTLALRCDLSACSAKVGDEISEPEVEHCWHWLPRSRTHQECQDTCRR